MKFKKTSIGKGKRAFVFFHGWKGSSRHYFAYKPLSKKGACIFYDYTPDILSSDVQATLNGFKGIIQDALKAVEKHSAVSVFGSSLGSTLAWMLVKKCKKTDRVILNTLGYNFAETVWAGKATQRIKKEVQAQNISLEQLDVLWKELSPEHNLKFLKGRNYLFYIPLKDKTIPFRQQLKLIQELKKIADIEVVSNPYIPHIPAVVRNILRIKKNMQFLLGESNNGKN